MTRNETRLALVAFAICLLCSACGNKKDLGADISMGVAGDGLIIPTSTASCVDKRGALGTRSVAKNAMVFSNFSLKYTGVGKTLYIGAMQVKVTSPAITDGQIEITLAPDEVEALLAAPGDLITVPAGTDSYTINSNSATRPARYPACQLAVGPITLQDPNTTTFSANVEISIIGSSSDSLGNVERIEKSISAKATY